MGDPFTNCIYRNRDVLLMTSDHEQSSLDLTMEETRGVEH